MAAGLEARLAVRVALDVGDHLPQRLALEVEGERGLLLLGRFIDRGGRAPAGQEVVELVGAGDGGERKEERYGEDQGDPAPGPSPSSGEG